MRHRGRHNSEPQPQLPKPFSGPKLNLEPAHSLLQDLEGRLRWTVPFLWPSYATDWRSWKQPRKSARAAAQRPEEVANQHRRPADIFLPSFNGVPAALDLAITAPQRQDIVALAGATSLAAATSCAATKASHLNTATLCAQQGVHFMPVVAESTGAWEPEASKLLLQLSPSTAAQAGEDAAALHADLLQELSVVIRSHRARAVLRRRTELADSSS